MPSHPPPAQAPRDVIHLDTAALKVLAHPLRSRVLTLLRTGGPATATGLARALATNSGATSYHLRRLESVGLVEDSGAGRGKERVWRAASERHSWLPSEAAPDPDAATALGWLERDYVRHLAEQLEQWLDVAPGWPAPWRDTSGMDDAMVLVTVEQLAALRAELAELVARYRRVGQGNPQAKRVALYSVAFPLNLGRPNPG